MMWRMTCSLAFFSTLQSLLGPNLGYAYDVCQILLHISSARKYRVTLEETPDYFVAPLPWGPKLDTC